MTGIHSLRAGLPNDGEGATAGEDRRTAGETFALLLVIAGGRRGVAKVAEYRAIFGGAGSDLRLLGAIQMKIVSQCREQARWVYNCRRV